jgi:hypothetical protein
MPEACLPDKIPNTGPPFFSVCALSFARTAAARRLYMSPRLTRAATHSAAHTTPTVMTRVLAVELLPPLPLQFRADALGPSQHCSAEHLRVGGTKKGVGGTGGAGCTEGTERGWGKLKLRALWGLHATPQVGRTSTCSH